MGEVESRGVRSGASTAADTDGSKNLKASRYLTR